MGRHQIKIDQTEFEKLCELQCTIEEIAGFFDCCKDTIENWCQRTYNMKFSEIFFIKRQKGKISLRRSQFQLAEKNPTMAIFLGKNYLGQTDEAIGANSSAMNIVIAPVSEAEEPPEEIEEEDNE